MIKPSSPYSVTKQRRFILHISSWLISCILCTNLMAGKYAASFLEIGAGAKGLGMGGSIVAHSDDGFAFYWNPAGLASIRKIQISGMFGSQFGGFKESLGSYHQAGFTLPLKGQAVISLNWIRFAVDDIPVFSELQGNSFYDRLLYRELRPTGEAEGYIQDSENALFFSFAKHNSFMLNLGWAFPQIRMEMPVGLNIKWIRQKLGSSDASGLGVDLGVMLRFRVADLVQNRKFGKLGFGLYVKDLTRSNLNWSTKHQDTVPLNLIWGVSYIQNIRGPDAQLTLSQSRESRWGGLSRYGLEFLGWQTVALRVGFVEGKAVFGGGLKSSFADADYAFEPHELNGRHRISLIFRL